MVNAPQERQSQGKLWWRLVAILTCQSFVTLGFWELGPFEVPVMITGAQQLYQVARMIKGNQERVVLDLLSNLKMVIALRGQILVSRTDDDPTPSCVHLKRPCVYVQNVTVCTTTTHTPRTHTTDTTCTPTHNITRRDKTKEKRT